MSSFSLLSTSSFSTLNFFTSFYNRTQAASSLFLQHNTALVPPYRVLIDTNFINFSLQNKLELMSGMMDCLYAKCKWLFFSLLQQTLIFDYLYNRYTLCYGLRIGWIREVGTSLQDRVKVVKSNLFYFGDFSSYFSFSQESRGIHALNDLPVPTTGRMPMIVSFSA